MRRDRKNWGRRAVLWLGLCLAGCLYAPYAREAEGRFLRAMEQPAEITDVMGEGTADGDEETVTQKVAYITFDDGPSTHSGELLDILKEENVKATFLWWERKMKNPGKYINGSCGKATAWDFILILTFIKRFTVPQTIFRQICGS